MDRLTSMAVFVKAVELGSFAAAADAFEISGPMVGKHVRFLEDRLGITLLHRTTRKQSLTEPGKAYYERCRSILAEADAADALVAEDLAQPRGRLRVSLPVHFGRLCVMPIFLQLARRFPALHLDLSLTDRISDLAEEGYDFAVRTGELADRTDHIARRLATQNMIVVASPAYLQASGAPSTISGIEAHKAILYRRSGIVAPWVFPREPGPDVKIAVSGRLRLDDLDAIADAAVAGEGLAWLPLWLVKGRLDAGALVNVLPKESRFPYPVHAVWMKTAHVPFGVRLAIDELAKALPAKM